MKSGALLGLIAWQLMLVDCVPTMQPYDEMPRSLSNIELLVPLTSDTSGASDESDTYAAGERYERARGEKDMPFSNIPSSAFVLDTSSSAHKHRSGHKHRRQEELKPRPDNHESVESVESDESGSQGSLAVDIWRACSRVLRAPGGGHELLRALCAELLEPARPPPPARTPPPARACPCCTASARKEFMPIGENGYWVQSYMKSPRKRRHRPDF